MQSIQKTICGLTLAAVSMFGSVLAFGQATNSGDIRGTVTDTTGALLPNVTVTVLNVNTGVSKTYITDRDGLYDTNSIVAGRYKLTFTKAGFETYVRGPVNVEVGFSTVNAPLKVGSTSETITVNTDLPLLHTESGDQTATLEAHEMEQLPNLGGANGPDWQNFMILLPGTAGAPGESNTNPGQEVSVNGNLPYANVLQDGASTTLPSSQNANPAVFEDVQELQVSLSSFSAQYGIGGIVMNQITKGGTDKFHGVLYEYFQNASLNSLQASYNGNATTINPLNYDNFGGTVSGPVKIPLLGLSHKAFFFFGYDQIHNNTNNSATNTIPTTTVMAGQFTAANSYTIYDPTTQTIAYDSAGHPYPVRHSFMSEYGSNAIPAALVDNVSAAFQKFYPTPQNHVPFGRFSTQAPNFEGVESDNFFSQYPAPSPWRRYFGRLDYDITHNNRLTMSDTQADEGEGMSADNAVTACPIACQVYDIDNNNAQVSDVWTIGPRLINEARFGYTDQLNFYQDSTTGKNYPQQLGWQFAEANVLPSVQFPRNYPYAWIQPAVNAAYKEFVFDPSDVITMIRGKHVLHFGGEFAIYRDDTTTWGNINAGTLQFDGSYTENWTLNAQGIASPNNSSGEEYADFLLGYASNWSASYYPEYGVRLKKPQTFVQDDWKVRPNLILNLGLRYEISHGFNVLRGNEADFDPTVTNPANGTLGAYWFGETHANGRTSLEANVFSTVMPRVGFSWLFHPNTTLRGGFGVYSSNFSEGTYGTGLGASVSSSGSLSDTTNGIYPVTKFNGPGTTYPLGGGAVAPLPYTAASTDPTRFNGQSANYQPYHTPIPKVYQWNFGIERQLFTNLAVTLSYVASHGLNLSFPTDINAVPEADINPNAASDQTGCGTGAATCLSPYPLYQGISGSIYNAISNYNSLQATVTKRMSRGFSISANYVWSHMLDDQDSAGFAGHGGPQPMQYATTLTQNLTYRNYGPSNFDIRNAFKTYAVYDLPFGRGRQFLNKNWFVDEVIGGLQISGTLVLSSGNPFQIYTSDNNLYQGTGSQYPNRIPGVSLIPAGGRTVADWVNPLAFSDPGSGAFGDAQRNPVLGPGFQSENMSLLKAFNLPFHDAKLSFRVDASNVFNHTSIGNPGSITLSGSNGAGTPFTGVSGPSITSSQISGRNIQLGGRFSF